MAAAITISAQLTEQDIKRAAGEVEKTFKKAFDAVGEHAKATLKRIADTFGGGDFNQAARKLKETKDALQQTEKQALQLAQAQARLVAATGDLAGAERVLVNALQSAQKELRGAEHESHAFLRASTQLATVQKRLAGDFDETGRRGKVASEIIREGFSEVLEELIKDGSVANELTKAFFAMPGPAKLALGVIATGAIAAAAAIAGVVLAAKQIFEVAEKIGTKNKEDFDEFAKAIKGAGGEVTNLDRAMSQELLRSADKVKGAFDNLFIVMLRQSGPQLVGLLKQVGKTLEALQPVAISVGKILAGAFNLANASLRAFTNNAGRISDALGDFLSLNHCAKGAACSSSALLLKT